MSARTGCSSAGREAERKTGDLEKRRLTEPLWVPLGWAGAEPRACRKGSGCSVGGWRGFGERGAGTRRVFAFAVDEEVNSKERTEPQ